MQRTVLEEYVFNQALVDCRVDYFTCTDDFVQGDIMFNDNQCTDLLLSHAQTCHHYRHDVVVLQSFFLRAVEKTG